MLRPPCAALLSCALTVVIAACGSNPDGPDHGDGSCGAVDSKCEGNVYQVCISGQYVTADTCADACSATLGCVACDPAAGTACASATTVVACNADGTLGDPVSTCVDGLACGAGECTRACTADGVDLIYVVDDTNTLYSFDPRKLAQAQDPFAVIGDLDCPASSTPVPGWIGGVTPFSMSVDRDGRAWVLYSSGEIFNVDITSAACTATGYAPRQAGMDVFGMGFVSDTAGGNTETLFIAGGNPDATAQGAKLGRIDTTMTPLTATAVGTIAATYEFSPELSGTGASKLFGFYPGVAEAYVQEVDRTSGAALGVAYGIPGGLGNQVQAWAFAQWGGVFYVFVTTTDGQTSNSTVRTIDGTTGAYALALDHLAFNIVGAGVSTCAPTDPIE